MATLTVNKVAMPETGDSLVHCKVQSRGWLPGGGGGGGGGGG